MGETPRRPVAGRPPGRDRAGWRGRRPREGLDLLLPHPRVLPAVPGAGRPSDGEHPRRPVPDHERRRGGHLAHLHPGGDPVGRRRRPGDVTRGRHPPSLRMPARPVPGGAAGPLRMLRPRNAGGGPGQQPSRLPQLLETTADGHNESSQSDNTTVGWPVQASVIRLLDVTRIALASTTLAVGSGDSIRSAVTAIINTTTPTAALPGTSAERRAHRQPHLPERPRMLDQNPRHADERHRPETSDPGRLQRRISLLGPQLPLSATSLADAPQPPCPSLTPPD